MTREEAIKSLQEDGIDLGAGDFVSVEALRMAIAALREQEKLESNLKVLESSGWISVEERLPEKAGMYLVHEKGFNECGGYMNVICFSPCYNGVEEHLKGRKMWYDYDSEYGDFEIRNVTHWMPLPEPPKEEV